jgi:hypothetical protein
LPCAARGTVTDDFEFTTMLLETPSLKAPTNPWVGHDGIVMSLLLQSANVHNLQPIHYFLYKEQKEACLSLSVKKQFVALA